MEIIINAKSVYGRFFFYPVCEKAKIFAEMVNKKTLTYSDLDAIERLGYKVTKQDNPKSWRDDT
jgi:hypothetical protein